MAGCRRSTRVASQTARHGGQTPLQGSVGSSAGSPTQRGFRPLRGVCRASVIAVLAWFAPDPRQPSVLNPESRIPNPESRLLYWIVAAHAHCPAEPHREPNRDGRRGTDGRGRCAGRPIGAVATFVGTVRRENLGRQVAYLEYEAYEPLAVKALGLIAGEVAGHWPAVRLAVHHRTGRLEIGEASIVIAAASPHRADAFRGVPLRDRAREADRADLEARVLRRRRRLDRRAPRRTRDDEAARQAALAGAHARDGPAVRAAARYRRRAASWRATSPPARRVGTRLADAGRASSRRSPRPRASMSAAVNADYATVATPVSGRRRGRVPAAGVGWIDETEPCSTNCNSVEAQVRRADSALLGDGEGRRPTTTEYRKHAKALAEIEPLVEKFREYKARRAGDHAGRGAGGSGDAEMRELAQEELQGARDARARRCSPSCKILLDPEGPERREERRARNPRRHRRRRGGAVRRRAVPDVHALRRAPGLEDRGACRAARPASAA